MLFVMIIFVYTYRLVYKIGSNNFGEGDLFVVKRAGSFFYTRGLDFWVSVYHYLNVNLSKLSSRGYREKNR